MLSLDVLRMGLKARNEKKSNLVVITTPEGDRIEIVFKQTRSDAIGSIGIIADEKYVVTREISEKVENMTDVHKAKRLDAKDKKERKAQENRILMNYRINKEIK